jgi:hypothetical protein
MIPSCSTGLSDHESRGEPVPTFVRRMHELIEPIHLTVLFAEEPNAELQSLGLRDNYWDGYFAGRAAPLGRASAATVHAIFYNFQPEEVARHIPYVWDRTTPEEALAARQSGVVAALRRILGDLADDGSVERAAETMQRAALSAPPEGRALYAGLRALPCPDEPIARLWHAATLLREHRGDGHNIALATEGIGGTEAHALHALSEGMPAERFGRIHHLPQQKLAAVRETMHSRGLVDDEGWLTAEGRAVKQRVEDRTDALALRAYDVLSVSERDSLVADLGPISGRLSAAGSR